jgi:phosphoglycerate dehydrogenase-like enzyme
VHPKAVISLSPELVPIDHREQLEELVEATWVINLDALEDTQRAGVEVLISAAQGLPSSTLERFPDLKVIFVTGTEFEFVDRLHCESHGITVCNTPEYTGPAVAEHAFAQFLALAKRLPELDAAVRKGKPTATSMSVEVAGKTAGILGYGDIGSRIGNFASAFGMEVVYVARSDRPTANARRVAFDELLHESDVIFLALPETSETAGMIDADAFDLMRPETLLVNVSAAGLVDLPALRHALETQQIRGAAFDVVDPDPVLLKAPRLLLTPGHGWYTPECLSRRATIWGATVKSYLAGTPINVVIGSEFGKNYFSA